MHLHSFVKYNYQSYFIEFIITALLFRQLFLIDFFILHIFFPFPDILPHVESKHGSSVFYSENSITGGK